MTVLVGIAGGPGSGKTSLATKIRDRVGEDRCLLIAQDSYYKDGSSLTPAAQAAINYDHPDALDLELLRYHVEELRDGRAIIRPTYDFATHDRAPEGEKVAPAPVVVVEGILVLSDARLRELFDAKIFVDTDADIRLMRRIRRDLEARGRTFSQVRKQYYDTVRPMHLAFVEPSKRFADIIIPEGGENLVAREMILAMMQKFLRERVPAS